MIRKIYLEVDEEITSVIEKMESVPETEIALVFPKDSGLLQSIVNLKLIKKEADKLQKEISIITSNKIGRNLAEQIGLKASDHLETRKEQLTPDREVTKEKIPIEFKKNHRSKSEEDDEIVFRKESVGEDEVRVREDEEIGTLRPSDSSIGDRARVDSFDKRAKIDASLGNGRFKLKFPFKSFGVFVSTILIGLIIFGYIYIPRTEITIVMASEKRAFETDITVDKNEKTNLETGVLKGEVVEFTKEGSKKFNATGTKEIGTKATGTIRVENRYSTTTQTLVSGTRFLSAGLIFKSTANVDVPGYTDPGGGIIPGSANVSVEAENPGSNYNIGPATFTIPGFQGTDKYEKITGVSTAPMTGGESKKVTIVTSSDVAKAKDEFSKEIVEEAKKEAKEKVEKENILREEALSISVLEVEPSPGINSEADQFSLKIKVKAKGVTYKESDLKKAYEKKAEAEGRGVKSLIESGYDEAKVTSSKVDFENGTFSLNFKSTIYLSPLFDQNMLKDEIIGQTKAKSEEFIKSQEGVKEVKFKFWPSFIKRIPRLKSHIKIRTEVSEVYQEKDEGVTDSG